MGHISNQTTVVWYTDISAESQVEYGITSDYGFTAEGSMGIRHEVTLIGLQPGTDYYYRVRSAGANLASSRFVSAKAPGTPFRIGLFSDAHLGGTAGVGSRMALYEPDLVLAVGDLTDNGLTGELHTNLFMAFPDTLKRAPLYWTPGNHDILNSFNACRNAFTLPPDEINYWFEYADAQIISLDGSIIPEGLPGTDWLENALAASDKPWKIVFLHQPGRCGGGAWERALVRDEYVPIMEHYGVQLVVSGHVHYFWRSVPLNGVIHLTLGRSGNRSRDLDPDMMPWYSAAGMNGSVAKTFSIADFNGPYLHLQTLTENGSLVDEMVLDRDCDFQLDGVLDPDAIPVASRSGGLTLWAAISGRYLYLATQDAGEGNDHFIFLTTATGGMTTIQAWKKTGTVAAFDAYLVDENDNRVSRWHAEDGLAFNDLPVARSATYWDNGGVLEGVLDLQDLFGAIPDILYLAAAAYGTSDNGALVPSSQCPAGNGNGHIEFDEFAAVPTAPLMAPFFMDGQVDHKGYLIAENNRMKLWAAIYEDILYVATWAAGDTNTPNDHFIFVTDTLSTPGPSPAYKAGQVAFDISTKPYLADESTSTAKHWYNGTPSAKAAAGTHIYGTLEGTLNLVEAFGYLPDTLYVAVAPYGTANGGALCADLQVPAGNGDGNVDGDEFVVIPVNALRDSNPDGILDYLDPHEGFVLDGAILGENIGTQLRWPTIPNHAYRIQSTPNLSLPFEDLSPDLPAVQGQFQMLYTNTTPAAEARFFRVYLIP